MRLAKCRLLSFEDRSTIADDLVCKLEKTDVQDGSILLPPELSARVEEGGYRMVLDGQERVIAIDQVTLAVSATDGSDGAWCRFRFV